MATEIESAFQRFLTYEAELRAALTNPLNESDTRFQVIDLFLIEILNWSRSSVKTEPHTAEGYIDYLLKLGDIRSAFVIEAKRNGTLDAITQSNVAASLTLNGPVLKPLLQTTVQALRYAADEGVPHAAITDGNCWLFFKASRQDGRKPLEGRGVFFRTIDVVKTNFTVFYELLAPIALSEKRNIIHLNKAEGVRIADAEEQFYVSDPTGARMLPRQNFASDATLLFTQFFSQLSDDTNDDMLDKCFVESSESRKAETELKKITENLTNAIISIDTEQGAALQQEIKRAISSSSSETVLLVGTKGAGKSTFMRRFFRKVLSSNLREQCCVITVDLEAYRGSKEDISNWLIKRLREQAERAIIKTQPPNYDELRGIFWSEYQRWQNGTHKHLYERDRDQFRIEFGRHIEELRQKDPDTYVRLLIKRCLTSNKRLPCIIFDNTDQFSDEEQDRVYQLAHALGVDDPIFSVVPITDRTIWRLGKDGALQSYSANVFYLPVPEAKEIISKRVGYVKLKLQDEPNAAREYFSAKGFSVSVNDLGIIADAIERVLVQQDYVSGLIGRLGNFDIRRMLQIARRIFVSPEIRIDDIVSAHFKGRPITLDKYRTYRALLKGEYDRFAERHNDFVINVFATEPHHPASPLLALYLLWILRSKASVMDESAYDKHMRVSDLCDFIEACGVAQDTTLKTLQKLHGKRLIEELDPNTEVLVLDSLVIIKEAGVAHIDLVLSSPTYIEQMALSTGLNSRAVRDSMRSELRNANSQAFKNIANNFLQYVLKLDATRINIPSNSDFRPLQEARGCIMALETGTLPPQLPI